MPLSLDAIALLIGPATPWALVLARASGLAWSAPGLATPGMGVRSRLILAASLTALLAPLVGPDMVIAPGLGALGWAVVVEVIVGLALAGPRGW